MAKRIKIKGKAPRGLSKAQRIKIAPLQREVDRIKVRERSRVDPGDVSESTLDRLDRLEYMIEKIAGQPDIQHGASSARKKRVTEGSRKFVGPRTLGSEVSEDAATRFRESFGPSRTGKETPAYVMTNVGKKGNLPRISKSKKQKTPMGANSRIKTLIALKRLSESGQLPGEVGRMLRDIPGI
jgi:hypothetical protein